MKICTVKDCENIIRARGFCVKHWKRWRKGKSLTKKSNIEKYAYEIFWERVDVKNTNECWEWAGNTRGNGKLQYGMFCHKSKVHSAHRYSYLLHHGEIPSLVGDYRGSCICHTCDNTLCVNPKHLFVATHSENMKDKKNKGRTTHKEYCKRGHKYNKKNTYITKKGLRHCRACQGARRAEKRIKEYANFN